MRLPLAGVRVVEMGQLIAIPYATKLLADMGAEVVRIESCSRLEGYRATSFFENDPTGEFWNRAANFYEQNRNKLGVTLDLADPEGLSLLKELIAVSDVFAENFTPRVVRKFGLEYDDVRQIRPDIVMVSSTGYGHTGPWAELGAIGYATEAASGLAHVTGYLDGPPVMPEIPYADFTAAEHTVFAIMAALVHRARTGSGQFIDVSQTETLSSTIPETLMDYTVNGRTQPRMGNQDPAMAPHGCYPCLGDDRWIAIAVGSDQEWTALCDVLGGPTWTADSRFASAGARHQHREELDRLLAEYTRPWDQHELMHALQGRGVPAGAVLDGKQLLFDPHLEARGFYETVAHHESTGMPPLPYPSTPWRVSETTPPMRAAPLMGEHNGPVISDLLGRSEEDLEELERKGVIGYRPVDLRIPPVIPLDTQKRQGRILRYELDFHQQIRKQLGEPPA
jgi:benzylsuccinate CoA-transferase BbsF subunit